jgi:hypothetical protein
MRWLVLAVVLFGVGWMAGRATRSVTTSPPSDAAVSAVRREAPSVVRPPGNLSEEDCEAQVASRLDDLETMQREAYGEAEPFPSDLHPAFHPDNVAELARRVELDCPELGWKLLEVECSEYPCFTVWDPPDSSDEKRATYSEAMACGAAVRLPRPQGYASATTNGMIVSPTGDRIEVEVVASFPPGAVVEGFGEPRDDRRKTRLSYRSDLVLAGLEETSWQADVEQPSSPSRE